ncbi:putative uncharacterized protein WWC2-AS2 [Panicum virgatum]|uniref:putative uncharacterized protein WWC2-AS2 n=1 Tax=Panicum virgatum TaxID=38727 RepID=UPI0019D528B6|nr:putative uncharacterized protein WWC2-AS2 [Panicum virgatum]
MRAALLAAGEEGGAGGEGKERRWHAEKEGSPPERREALAEEARRGAGVRRKRAAAAAAVRRARAGAGGRRGGKPVRHPHPPARSAHAVRRARPRRCRFVCLRPPRSLLGLARTAEGSSPWRGPARLIPVAAEGAAAAMAGLCPRRCSPAAPASRLASKRVRMDGAAEEGPGRRSWRGRSGRRGCAPPWPPLQGGKRRAPPATTGGGAQAAVVSGAHRPLCVSRRPCEREGRGKGRERHDDEGRRRLEELAEGHLHGCGCGGRSGRRW